MSLNVDQAARHPERVLETRNHERRSHQQGYDVVVIGFGTSSLALASSLTEKSPDARILFVEREQRFTWSPEHVLPDNEIGGSFLRDLVTTQNPRSEFTFVNFLHSTNQLIRFTNNSRLAPTRRLMGLYFRWAANKIEQLGWVKYRQEAVLVKPVTISASNRVAQWMVDVRDSSTGAVSTVQAKRVVLESGATPHIPTPLAAPQVESLVLHSSSSTEILEKLASLQQTLSIAILGADQEATELFQHLQTTRGPHTATMFFAESALRPDDHTPNVQEMLDKPETVEGSLPPEVRQRMHSSETHHSPKIHLGTLESLYEAQYGQKIKQPDASKWPFQIRSLSEVVGAKREQDKIRLVTRNARTGEVATSTAAFDVVIAATGYKFATDMKLAEAVVSLLDAGALTVDREYRVNFRRGVLAGGCGMWLLGSLEDTNERVDTFNLMAERARRCASSIVQDLAKKRVEETYGELAQL